LTNPLNLNMVNWVLTLAGRNSAGGASAAESSHYRFDRVEAAINGLNPQDRASRTIVWTFSRVLAVFVAIRQIADRHVHGAHVTLLSSVSSARILHCRFSPPSSFTTRIPLDFRRRTRQREAFILAPPHAPSVRLIALLDPKACPWRVVNS
jgi:hypothetical protein